MASYLQEEHKVFSISTTGNVVVRRRVKLLTKSVEEECDAQDDEASVLKERQHGGQTPEEERKLRSVM